MTLPQTLVILGAGYTARFVLPHAEHRYARICLSSRDPDRHLSHTPPDRRVQFDLEQSNTWKNIPSGADLLWCFPAAPLPLVQQMAQSHDLRSHRLVVLGSTSAYREMHSDHYPPPWIDETAPIVQQQPRVAGEEFLRTTCRATVLRVAGIYGPGRNPIDWIKEGRVRPSRKYVNLIHVEDLAAVCLTALDQGIPGEIYNVSDGTPRTWTEICRSVQDRWGIQSVERHDEPTQTGKRIANGKLLAMLEKAGQQLRYADLGSALNLLGAPAD